MNQLTKVFDGQEVRLLEENGQPMFIASDVAKILGYTNTSKAINDHCKGVTKRYIPTDGGLQELNVIFEPDLYRLIFKSKLPSAQRFEDWIMIEVLPAIRQDGGYIAATAEQTTEEIMARAVLVANKALERIQKERDQIASEKEALLHSGKLYTSTEIAKELGLRSATALNQLLGDNKIQYRVNKTWVLSAKYADKGYTSIKQHVLDNGRTVYDRKWTGIGRDFLIQKFSLQEETA